MQGKLGDFSPGELIQIVGFLGKSGVLRLQHGGDEGLVAFRGGKVIYAASPSVRESLGGLLISRGLIDATELTEALSRQTTDAQKMRLGAILVEMGAIEEATLEDLIREQFCAVISGFVDWREGTFGFEVKELADRGEVALEAADFLTVSGVESTHVLLDAARREDHRQHEEEPRSEEEPQPVFEPQAESEPQTEEGPALEEEPPPEGAPQSDQPDSLDVLVEQATSPTIHGEIVHRLLDLGHDTCERCLLFAVHPERFQVVGHVGLDEGPGGAPERLLNLEIPSASPSILARAVDQGHSILSNLAVDGEDGKILECLGAPPGSKSVAIPLSIEERVALVLYGDNLPEDLGTGQLEELEAAASDLVRSAG